ncbi:nicotinate phosphoribosyltransferase [Candidatus Nitrospira bockiana]
MRGRTSVLLTDLYQLTMLQTYFERGMTETAVFEFFVRTLPPRRGFLMAAGLEQALDYLETFRFEPWELDWLAASGRFSAAFVDRLASLRFTGDVEAMPEGTIFFPHEPILRVVAPLPQAQLVETRLINLLHFQTVVASKAARLVLAVRGVPLIDFGLRRAHGAEAGLLAARAGYLAGLAGTATVLAGVEFDIPIYGTMAHSFIQAHVDERTAFAAFARSHPDHVTLLIDTYDTEEGARTVVALAPRLAEQGVTITGVRLDSGDLADHARKVRRILDAGTLAHVKIIASGNLDEAKLQHIVASGAPIDTFAVGTHVTTSADAPSLDCAYKLQEYAGRPCRKRSEGKATWPGRKQVYREYGADGRIARDVLTVIEDRQGGQPLLERVMEGGKRVEPARSLRRIREYAAEQLACLPEPLQRLEPAPPIEVIVSPALKNLAAAVDATMARRGE